MNWGTRWYECEILTHTAVRRCVPGTRPLTLTFVNPRPKCLEKSSTAENATESSELLPPTLAKAQDDAAQAERERLEAEAEVAALEAELRAAEEMLRSKQEAKKRHDKQVQRARAAEETP